MPDAAAAYLLQRRLPWATRPGSKSRTSRECSPIECVPVMYGQMAFNIQCSTYMGYTAVHPADCIETFWHLVYIDRYTGNTAVAADNDDDEIAFLYDRSTRMKPISWSNVSSSQHCSVEKSRDTFLKTLL